MAKLDYTLTNDTLFKMLFVRYPALLKRLVAALLGIQAKSIEQLIITNSEIPPDTKGDKFCRLDINMKINGQRVDLEVQVDDEGDYPERSLYYWAREFSSELHEGDDYIDLPKTILISIVTFNLFKCTDFHSEFQALEVTRHTALTDKMHLCYFELSKLPNIVDAHDELKLWLKLFKAESEEDLRQIEALGVPIMDQAIEAYRQTKAADEFRELERLRSRARHNEAAALRHAREEARTQEKEKLARNLLAEGMSVEQAARLAELPTARVRALKNAANSQKK
ncbi:MAG: Rpn family recombination-promoting nuclease/putative transposase [Spirochaetota bacterium]|nr:Rpn family recombination-promoting nuclease/putative transposase [Spirochaetota bacterium]